MIRVLLKFTPKFKYNLTPSVRCAVIVGVN
jgi:hypothetical protein